MVNYRSATIEKETTFILFYAINDRCFVHQNLRE
jgi:hypothetical protein